MLLTVDFIEFAIPVMDIQNLISFLGMEDCNFEYGNRCFFNYNDSIYYAGIKLGYNGTKGYQVYVQMSGSGCRTFESIHSDNFDWLKFIIDVLQFNADFRRLDIAADDYSNNLNIYKLARYYEQNKIAGACRTFRYILGSEECFYAGSSQSNTLIRIYNKALERGYNLDDLGHPWYRCEIQLRKNNAIQFINEWIGTNNLQKIYSGHVHDWLRFLQKPNDKENSQRIDTAKFWLKFLENAERIKFVSKPGVVYNLRKCEKYIYNQCASNIKLFIKANKLTSDEAYKIFTRDDILLRSDQKVILRDLDNTLNYKILFDESGKAI